MCATCGCGGDHRHHEAHDHAHTHSHDHAHEHDHATRTSTTTRTSKIARAPSPSNRRSSRAIEHLAEHNRASLRRRNVAAFNLMSSPGAGKTTLLERTLRAARRRRCRSPSSRATRRPQADADRIRAAGGRAVQINTGTGCHLDAAMVARARSTSSTRRRHRSFIENVGNLVCPALFDLGERARVVIASVTEGEDKPLKYPHMFRAAELVLLNKIDLLPHVDFSVDVFRAHARTVNPRARILPLSARSGDGCRRVARLCARPRRRRPGARLRCSPASSGSASCSGCAMPSKPITSPR